MKNRINRVKKMSTEVSIIIKALNEEKNIARAIKSSKAATKGMDAEIILADSLSTDKTVEIAKKEKIKIVQLKNASDRSCGIGPQLGYQYASGKYIYILDGDMELEKGFLKKAIMELEKDKKLAGIAGQVKEMNTQNIVFERRKKGKKQVGYFDKLEMGGLYKREALEDVGYFSNRNLHAYEEAELGFRLTSKGWKLKRVNIPGVKHYGYTTNTFGVFKKRWKTRYVKGSGEFLRSSFGKPYFLKTLWHLKIYVFLAFWWLLFVLSIVINYSDLTKTWLIISIFLLVLFFLKKKDVKEFSFSIVSWHYSTIGLIWGFFSPKKNPNRKISAKVIK